MSDFPSRHRWSCPKCGGWRRRPDQPADSIVCAKCWQREERQRYYSENIMAHSRRANERVRRDGESEAGPAPVTSQPPPSEHPPLGENNQHDNTCSACEATYLRRAGLRKHDKDDPWGDAA